MYNLLIVDDESIIREGILEIVSQFKCFNLLSARNGQEALYLISKNKIDGMILDVRMPKVNGIEVLKSIISENLYIPTIILTGYDDFTYAREALKYGAIDYVLKPVMPDDIKNLCYKLKHKLDEEKKEERELLELKKEVAESKCVIKERFFYDILKGKVNKELYKDKANFLGIDYLGDYFGVVLIELELADFISRSQSEEEYQILIKFVENTLKDLIVNIKGFELFHLNTDIFAIIFNFQEYTREYDDIIYEKLLVIKKQILAEKNLEVTIGLGEVCIGIENIRQSYYQAQTALRYKMAMGKGQIYNIRDFKTKAQDIDLEVDLEEIVTLLKTGQTDIIEQEIRSRFKQIRNLSEKVDIYSIYILCSKYLSALLSGLKEYGVSLELLFSDSVTPFAEFLNKHSILELEDWLTGLLNRIKKEVIKYQNTKDLNLVDCIKKHIKENYKDELTNSGLAGVFGYSSNYMGQVFKNETGSTINEYINKIRIQQAKMLIKETHLMIYQIAYRVGFNDQHYFSLVFKKLVGVTPKQYREL